MINARTQAAAVKKLRVFRADRRGSVAIDFALIGPILALGIINAVDVGFFIYQRMEVEYAAEVGAQAAWANCNNLSGSNNLPATQNCSAINTAITAAIQSTSLGTNISLASGYPTEAYYCTNTSNTLQYVGSISSSPPADCSAAGNASASPGDYIQVGVTYSYTPLFPGSVMGNLGISSIGKTSWMRLG